MKKKTKEYKKKQGKKYANPSIYKITEFKKFIATLEVGSIGHWVEIAKAIGVSRDTITEWMKLPQAQEARKKGIDFALEQMEHAGKKDWRMWKDKLSLLDVQATEKKDITTGGDPLDFKIEIVDASDTEAIDKNE